MPDNQNYNFSTRNNLEDIPVKGDWIPVVRKEDAEKAFRNMGDVLKKDGKKLGEAMTEISSLKAQLKAANTNIEILKVTKGEPTAKTVAKPKPKTTKK